MTRTNDKDIERLNSFLAGELSAVETYRQCIAKIDDAFVAGQLRRLLASHEQRTVILTQKILSLRGIPTTGSGLWGAFARLVEGGSTLLGDSVAMSTLEEGEDRGRSQYAREVADLSAPTRAFVEQDIIPEQSWTRHALAALQRR
jgi:demethoxyubiquinone hydroxylase (CLK1/Coq7/Cat5 family)